MKTSEISYLQAAALMIISRIAVSLTYAPIYSPDVTTAELIAPILALPLSLIETIPVFILLKKGKSVIDGAFDFSKTAGKITVFLYVAFLVFTAAVSSASFDVFISSLYFVGSDYIGILVMTFLSGFAAYQGLEGIARTASIVVFAVLGAVLLLFIVPINQFDFLNIINPFFYEDKSVFKSVVLILSHNAEAGMLAVGVNYIREKAARSYIIYSAVSALFVCIVVLTIILTVGDFTALSVFPYSEAAKNVSYWSFASTEPILIGFWIVAVFFKLSFCISLSMLCLERIFKNRIVISAVLTAVLYFATLYLSSGKDRYFLLYNPVISLFVNLCFAVVLPLTVCFLKGKKS